MVFEIHMFSDGGRVFFETSGTSTGLQRLASQKMVPFIIIAMGTSNPVPPVCYLRARDQVSHPYEGTGGMTVMYTVVPRLRILLNLRQLLLVRNFRSQQLETRIWNLPCCNAQVA
jgi:hypothetical protein